MLDQNTDRMWYVIGALVVGAGIILLANKTMPDVFASVSKSFEQPLNSAIGQLRELANTKNLYTNGDFRYQGVPTDKGYTIGNSTTSIVQKNIPVKPNTTYELRYYKKGVATNMKVLTFSSETTKNLHNEMYKDHKRVREIDTFSFDRIPNGDYTHQLSHQTDNEIVAQFTTADNETYISLTSGNYSPSLTSYEPFDFQFIDIRLYEL